MIHKENLSIPVVESNDDLVNDKDNNQITFDYNINTEIVDWIKRFSDDVVSYSLISTLSIAKSSSIVAIT
ncbi:unnamed protein product [Rotaria sordida]|uniref:Uncharacterized protein n=1 Tax=Rotaria sordida TaxID=392033 RepID=A0A819V4D1_9BILA|nr:unnamed protein product [Rotaria sordida]CAF4104135.1 unnamed protein product [Rotaria sordida]